MVGDTEAGNRRTSICYEAYKVSFFLPFRSLFSFTAMIPVVHYLYLDLCKTNNIVWDWYHLDNDPRNHVTGSDSCSYSAKSGFMHTNDSAHQRPAERLHMLDWYVCIRSRKTEFSMQDSLHSLLHTLSTEACSVCQPGAFVMASIFH